MLVAFSVSPSGGDNPDASVHDAVAAAVHVVRESGLPNRTDSMFTTIEGEWDECMAVVKEATAAVAEYGPRVSLVLKADIRPGHTGELTGKLERLESALAHHELGRSQERRGITSGVSRDTGKSGHTACTSGGASSNGPAGSEGTAHSATPGRK